jgi:L-alanine-DL-glutamate epimerase-like enolase superfamily enzyme
LSQIAGNTAEIQQVVAGKASDVRVTAAELYLLPVQTRVPLKFGAETLTSVTCARVRVTVVNRDGQTADGWGETPLSVQWVWPSELSYAVRSVALQHFCRQLAVIWVEFGEYGHPLEVGDAFSRTQLPTLRERFNDRLPGPERLPMLAALACSSPFDIALHDAYGRLADRPVYETYSRQYMNRDLSAFLEPAADSSVSFRDKYPCDFLRSPPVKKLAAWHLVGGLDPLTPSEVNGNAPHDARPYILADWIRSDGLRCLKIKLRGNDAAWDYDRVVQVGRIAIAEGVEHLTTDFNCTVHDPAYVNDILDKLKLHEPAIYTMILYVEQPFPYDLTAHALDVHCVTQRKPLLMDESADNWTSVRKGRSLGWNGVALKTCKTQTGAILSLCWAKAHGMHVMVQDLTNPMLAQIPHVLLAAHADTMMGVESNAMQFYPDASTPEARVHPGLFRRRDGELDLSSLKGSGFGYRVDEIDRTLPTPAVRCVAKN